MRGTWKSTATAATRLPTAASAASARPFFPAAQLDLSLRAGNVELASFSDAAVRDYLARVGSGTVVDRVRAVLAEHLSGDLSPGAVARKLGLSLRSMQRSLREHDTSYEELLRSLRLELACRYLRERRYAHKEVAFLLGYESLSAFTRAFRRWTNLTPSEYAERGEE